MKDKVFVFADSQQSRSGEKYGIKVFVQRGVLILPIELIGYKYKEGYIVDRGEVFGNKYQAHICCIGQNKAFVIQ